MKSTNHSHAALIDQIGRDVVRKNLGLSHQSLFNWRQRGVPHSKRYLVARLAAQMGIGVPDTFYGAGQ